MGEGVVWDGGRIREEGRVGAVLDERLIPRSSAAVSLGGALSDGEDFELLFTLSPSDGVRLVHARKERGLVHFTKIGEVVSAKHGIRILRKNGNFEKLKSKGFEHFK